MVLKKASTRAHDLGSKAWIVVEYGEITVFEGSRLDLNANAVIFTYFPSIKIMTLKEWGKLNSMLSLRSAIGTRSLSNIFYITNHPYYR